MLISTQVKDLLGLQMESVPSDFLPKWQAYFANLGNFSFSSVFIAAFSFAAIFYVRHKRPNLPAYLVAVVGATLLVAVFALFSAAPDTIGSKFGAIPHFLPAPKLPELDVNLMLKVFPSGLTIAFLAGVESLLSATVVDGMSGDNHNSNAELIAEGTANLMSMAFTGVPATGAIARTATNYKSGGYSPMAGIMQSVILLLFMLLLAGVAKFIPLACLSAILILVGWNMLNLTKMYYLLKGARGDALTLVVTLLLTLLVDLNTGISVGFILSSIIFMHRMSKEIEIETDEKALEYKGGGRDLSQVLHEQGVISLRFSGPLFFGDALDVTRFLQKIKAEPKIIIIRMGYVPLVDISGANALVSFIDRVKKKHGAKIILSNIKKQPRRMLHEAFLQNGLTWHDISTASTFENALKITRRYLRMKKRQEEQQAAGTGIIRRFFLRQPGGNARTRPPPVCILLFICRCFSLFRLTFPPLRPTIRQNKTLTTGHPCLRKKTSLPTAPLSPQPSVMLPRQPHSPPLFPPLFPPLQQPRTPSPAKSTRSRPCPKPSATLIP